MTLRRWHRLLGLIICVPCLLWGISGALLAWKNYASEKEQPGRRVAATLVPFTVPVERALGAAGRGDTPTQVRWHRIAGAPYYLIRYEAAPRTVLVHGQTAAVLGGSPAVDEALARAVAQQDTEDGSVATVRSVYWQTAGTLVYPEWGELPVWRVTLGNGDDVYVSPGSGQVLQHVDWFFRVIRVSFYGLHVWKLSPGPGSYLFLMGMGVLLIFGALSGIWMVVFGGRRRR